MTINGVVRVSGKLIPSSLNFESVFFSRRSGPWRSLDYLRMSWGRESRETGDIPGLKLDEKGALLRVSRVWAAEVFTRSTWNSR